jgi:hypothetical protein
MKKLTKTQFITYGFIFLGVIAILWSFLWDVKFPFDSVNSKHGLVAYGAVHAVFNAIFILGWVVSLITLFMEMDSDSDIYSRFYIKRNRSYSHDEAAESILPSFKFKKKWFVWIVIIVAACFLWSWGSTIGGQSVSMYNKSKMYHNDYTQMVQEKKGFYDKLWKTYLTKEKITNINKETFIQVAKIIMENRKDGDKISWKWVQENQQIPFSEFSKFYEDLSNFIAAQREGYFNIEKQCQLIANMNNTLLDTFPHNIYNKVLGCQRIKFEYGFLSDSTENVFRSKKENLK